MKVCDDLSIVQGRGLGGTSLINANVFIRPQTEAWQDPRIPQELRDPKGQKELAVAYEKARRMLGANPLPAKYNPAKLQTLEKMAKADGAKFYRANLNVTFRPGTNQAGVQQVACTLCGNC